MMDDQRIIAGAMSGTSAAWTAATSERMAATEPALRNRYSIWALAGAFAGRSAAICPAL